MSLGPQYFWLKIVLASALVFGETSAFALNQCMQDIVDTCRSDASVTESTLASQMGTTGKNRQDVARTSEALRRGQAQMGANAEKCQASAKECEKCSQAKDKKKDPEVKKCQEAVAAQATNMKEQSSSMGGQGGDMGAIAGLLGAAAGMAMAMMNKKDKPATPPQPIATGALQLNGALNCQMQDSFQYADCASFLTNYCSATAAQALAGTPTATPATGTIISAPGGGLPPTPDCTSFNASYCSQNVAPPQPYGMMRSDGAVTQVNMAGSGGGLGTEYCARTIASSWCTPEKSMCPSCRQNDMYNSATCISNPALCQSTTSPQQITAATSDPVCSGDPLFTPGSPYAIAGTIDNGSSGTALPAGISPLGTGVPMIGVGGGGGIGGGVGVGGFGTPTTGLPVAILPKSVSSGAGFGGREGKALGKSTSGANGIDGSNIKTSSAHAHANANELIAAGGVIMANGPNVPSRGPASDVEGKFGPSLFSTSSQVIRSHCEAGKLNCK